MSTHIFAYRIRRLGSLLGGALLCAFLASAAAAVTVKHGKEKEATTPQAAIHKVCDGCHNTEIVMDTPKDYDAWRDTIQDMINRGAKGAPAEFDLIMQYLYQNMTTVDVNHSDADMLQTVLGAPPEAVAAIMARRQTQPFKDLADLEASIPGLDGPALEAKRRMIFFQ